MWRKAIAAAIAVGFLSACDYLEEIPSFDGCGVERAESDWRISPVLRFCAEIGYPNAQAYLGMILWSASESETHGDLGIEPGVSREQLQQQGRVWIERAAAQGNADAQNELGLAHLESLFGVERNYVRAHQFFVAADLQGDRLAPYNLARMQFAGYGVPRSEWRAEQSLWRSVSRGYKPALCTLAHLRDKRGARFTASALRLVALGSDGFNYACSPSDVMTEFR